MRSRIGLTVLVLGMLAASAEADERRYTMKADTAPEVQAAYTDIKNTLGIVPTFMRDYPAASIPGAWQEFKNVQLSDQTALPGKIKEMIGLAVASQIPCSYCTEFHTEAGKLNGATVEELHEAIALAACTRHWSTHFHGSQVDFEQFKGDADKMLKKMEAMSSGKVPPPSVQKVYFANAVEARNDIESTFGFVPEFVQKIPDAALAGAWSDVKTLLFSNTTAIEPKMKDLISLAVSAQIPCEHCIYFDTKAAKADGATDQEVQEAIAMASITRKWSTVLNGLHQEPAAFKKEVNAILTHAKKSAKK